MNDALLALPEMMVAVAAMVLLLMGAFRGDKSGNAVTGAAAVSLLAAAVLVWLDSGKTGVAFQDMFAVDDFRRFVKIMLLVAGAGSLALAPAFFAQGEGGHKPEYSVLVMLAVLGMMLMVSANDWIALYVGLEFQNFALYVLVSFQRDQKRSSEAGLKYFMLSAFSSAIMLFGLSFVYGVSGGTGFVDTARVLATSQTLPIGIVAGLGFVLTGFAFKISAVPFHMWTPDVYEGAPTPVAAFLAAAPKIAALAILAIILALPLALAAAVWKPVIIVLSLASMVFGSFAGLMQTNLKRLMAYSAIANVGTIMVGLVCLDPMQGVICLDGLRGILIYLALYFVGVIGVFSVMLTLRKDGEPVEALSDLAGLSKAQPLLALAMAVSLFSLAGVPPLAGFFGKYFVLLAAVKAGVWPLALVGVLTSVVAAGYYLRIVKIMYFDDAEASALDPVKDNALKAVVVLVSLSVLLFVLVPAPLMDAARHAAEGLLPP